MSAAATDLLGGTLHRAYGAHESTGSEATVWLTPPAVLHALGQFDLDPCAAPEPRPWPTAALHFGKADNGLTKPWHGRVWMNPPYSGAVMAGFMRRMAAHQHGTALIFARTETALFAETVWQAATACLFIAGRLAFYYPDGRRARFGAGAPSVLVAYGVDDAARLQASGIAGRFVRLDAP